MRAARGRSAAGTRARRPGESSRSKSRSMPEFWQRSDTVPGMTHAVVLIKAERSALSTLGDRLADVDGVSEAYSITGEWDYIAILRVPEHDGLAELVTGRLASLDGIERTYTMVAFQGFSKHDLEAMFSIGA